MSFLYPVFTEYRLQRESPPSFRGAEGDEGISPRRLLRSARNDAMSFYSNQINLNLNILWESGHLNSRSCRRVYFKIFSVNFVHSGKFIHIREIDSRFHNIIET